MSFLSNLNNRYQSVSQGALIVAFFSIASRLVGLLRDRLLASTFGADSVLDSYYAAFKIPDFIFNTFVLGALTAAFIPVFIQYRHTEGQLRAYQLTNKVLNLLLIILALSVLVGWLTAPLLVKLIAPGFDLVSLNLTIKLTRVMLGAVIIFGAANVLGGVLQAEQRLLAFAAAPILYNLGIILGLLLFVPYVGAMGLAGGVILGSVLHLGIQWMAVWRLGWRWRPLLSLKDVGVKEVLKLLGPRTLGLAASQINQVVTVSFISHLSVGSLAAFSLALNLHSFPINVFGVSLAVAVFPLLSQANSVNNYQDFISYFSRNLRRVLFYVLPLSVLFLVLRAQLVRVVLGSGVFDWSDTIRTAQAVGFLSLAAVSDSLLPLVARSFYALKDTVTPLIASLVSLAINFLLLWLLQPYGLAGVGLAYVSASVVNLFILLAILGARLGSLDSSLILDGLWRMSIGSLVAAAAAYGTLHLAAAWVNMNTFWGIFLQGALAGMIGCLSYLIMSVTFKLPEVSFIKQWLRSVYQLLTKT